MITFRPVVYANHRRKDGSYPVKIVVYFKGKERKLATTISCTAGDLTRSLKIKSNNIRSKCDALIMQMREAVADISPFDLNAQDVDFVVGVIKSKLTRECFRLDFFGFAEEWLSQQQLAPSTAAGYRQAINAFARFIGAASIDINEVTHAMVAEFMEAVAFEPRMVWSKSRGELFESSVPKADKGQSARHVRKLARIYQAAKDKYNDEDTGAVVIPRSPFSRHDLRTAAPEGQKPLPVDLMQRLILSDADSLSVRTAIDAAVVSFGLMGANLADLYEAKKPRGGVWVYQRKKTRGRRRDKAEMRVNIPECLQPYIARLSGRGGWWFGRMHEMASHPEHITSKINAGLARWCEGEGIERFTFYAVRKTWATVARRIGVEKAIVDEGLSHLGDYTLTDIYAEKPWVRINEANARVLAQFTWPTC